MSDPTTFDQVRAAIWRAHAMICRRGFTGTEADKMLRIEMTYDAEAELRFHDRNRAIDWVRSGDEGPSTFFGVALYPVHKLPAPGWRLINPFN